MEHDLRTVLVHLIVSPPDSVDGPAVLFTLADRWRASGIEELDPRSPPAVFYRDLLVSTTSVKNRRKKQKKRGTVTFVGTLPYTCRCMLQVLFLSDFLSLVALVSRLFQFPVDLVSTGRLTGL